jgi:putative nucleotidyltransferase with HDIG domain
MGEDSKSKFLINVKDIKQAVQEYQNIVFQLWSLDSKIEKNISNLLNIILTHTNALQIKNVLFTIMRELLVNAVKANSKRIHFFRKNLDINNPQHYTKGIEDFKEELADKSEEFVALLHKNNLFVQVSISYRTDPIVLSVTNNNPISSTEKGRILDQKKKAAHLNNLAEVIEDIVDYSEGAGLGIPMIILMLKNAGADAESFQIFSDETYTRTRISIPKHPVKGTIGQKTALMLVEEVNELPPFPENITHIQRMINDGDSSLTDIANIVRQDPVLTADLLRMANSAGYATHKKIESIDEALRNIGLKSFNGILTAVGTFSVIEKRYKKVFKEVLQHSLKTAFFAEKLCTELNLKKLKNQAYLSGLLHDLGKIVLMALQPSTFKALTSDLSNIKISDVSAANPIEEITFGISHAEIGGLIASHWNFDPALCEAIKLHHQPFIASGDNKDLVYLTYLANYLLDVERGFCSYAHMESCVFNHFGLENSKIPVLAERLNRSFTEF